MGKQENRTVVLVAFYNEKALGVRYLEAALVRAGYRVSTVFFKRFNSRRPSPVTLGELELLCGAVRRERPLFVGLSVMSSMYLESVCKVMEALARALERGSPRSRSPASAGGRRTDRSAAIRWRWPGSVWGTCCPRWSAAAPA